jgi:Family of unknown function (DUF6525)
MTNLVSPRIRWRATNPMAEHDRLPKPLRGWLAQAALPWSAQSARRLWQRAIAETHCPHAAVTRLKAAEQKTLARQAARVWGKAYPTVVR